MTSASRNTLGLVLVAAVLILALGVGQSDAGQSALERLGVSGPPDRFTELAFADPRALPDRVPRETSRMRVPFTVRNVEGEHRRYTWSIVATAGGRRDVLRRGQTETPSGVRDFINPTVRIRCTGRRVRIDVKLDRPAQTIGMWLRCPSTPPEESRDG